MVVTVPPQFVVGLAGDAKYRFAGKVSVQAAGEDERVRGKELGLAIITVRVEMAPALMDGGVKLLFICAGSVVPWA